MPAPVDIATLQAQVAQLDASIDDVTATAEREGRALTADEQTEISDYETRITTLEAQIRDREASLATLARVNARRESSNRPTRPGMDRPTSPTAQTRIEPIYHRVGRLKAFRGPHAERDAYAAGQFFRAVLCGNERAYNWCTQNGLMTNVMHTGSNQAGGFLVPESTAAAIVDLREQYGVFRANAEVFPVTDGAMKIPRLTSDLTTYFVDEEEAITPSDLGFGQGQLIPKTLAALAYWSASLGDDAVLSLGDKLTQKAAWGFAMKEDMCGFIGDGTSTYGGMVGVLNAVAAGSIHTAAVPHNTIPEIDEDDLLALMAKLPEYAARSPNCAWYCSRTFYQTVMGSIMFGAGGNTTQNLAAGMPPMFWGYPVHISQVMPASLSTDYAGLPLIAFGDLAAAAAFGDRQEIRTLISPHFKMSTNQMTALFTERFDCVVHEKGTATEAGPIVVLVAGAAA